jgi:chromate transporter
MGPLAIFGAFLRFGFLAWGGPIAQIAMIRQALVDEQGWLTSERFNRLLAVYQALPGPEAHELCVHLGRMRGGPLGGFLAGLGFMLPGFVLVLGLAALYSRFDLSDPAIASAMLGIQIAVIALIVVAVRKIGGHILVDRWLWAIALYGFVATLLGVSFWIVLPVGGLVYLIADRGKPALAAAALALGAVIGWLTLGEQVNGSIVAQQASAPATLAALFLAGLKGGLLTFGGAYTAIPFVRDDAVGKDWVSDGQFLDGLALSGMVPAPLVIFVTFVGYISAGLPGALVITAGMFLPAFSFGLIFYDRLESIVENPRFHDVLQGIAAGVVGIIAATAIDLGGALLQRLPLLWAGLSIFVAALVVLLTVKSRYTALWLIPLAGVAGWTLLR